MAAFSGGRSVSEHELLASLPDLAQKIIHTRTQYAPHPAEVGCASGEACVAPPWLRESGKRPPSWEIDGWVYCADCTQAWAIATARLERGEKAAS